MGLNRYFTINAETKNREAIYDLDLANRVFNAIDDRYGGWEGNLDDNEDMRLGDVNWFDVDDDMKAVSKEFPDLVLTVICDGMSQDDQWMACYCDGRVSFAAMQYEPIDWSWLVDGIPGNQCSVELSRDEIDLISEALSVLREARESEMKWADAELRASDQAVLDRIDTLHEKLNGA